MASSKKTELISATYELLKKMSPEEITIRTIAADCNCSSTVVYKHFENLDHLVLLASVRFLENYVIELESVVSQKSNALDTLVNMWQIFANYAFANIDVFELLFWGKAKERLGDAIFEYYEIFPDKWEGLDGLFTSIFFNNDLMERNYIMVRRAAATGFFSYADSREISDMQCYLFHGMMMEYRSKYRTPGMSKEAAERFMKMLHSLIQHYQIK